MNPTSAVDVAGLSFAIATPDTRQITNSDEYVLISDLLFSLIDSLYLVEKLQHPYARQPWNLLPFTSRVSAGDFANLVSREASKGRRDSID